MVKSDLARQRCGTLGISNLDFVQRDFDRFVDRFLGGVRPNLQFTWHAPLSVWEDEQNVYVELDMPGVKAEDVEVTIEKGVLNIAFERRAPEGERKYWHQEQSYGRRERQLAVPDTVSPEGIEATLRDGTLSLCLHKRPETQPKRIDVKVG